MAAVVFPPEFSSSSSAAVSTLAVTLLLLLSLLVLLQLVVAQAIVVMKTAVVVVEVEGVSAEFSAGPSEAQTDSKKSTSGRWASEELSQRGAPPISTTSLPRP